MSASIATLPRSAGNGAALVMVVADLVMDFYAKATEKAAPQTAVSQIVLPQEAESVKAASVSTADGIDLWQLYRLGVSSDSVNPKVIAELQS